MERGLHVIRMRHEHTKGMAMIHNEGMIDAIEATRENVVKLEAILDKYYLGATIPDEDAKRVRVLMANVHNYAAKARLHMLRWED